MSDSTLNAKSLEKVYGSMSFCGTPPDIIITGGAILSRREARLMLGLKLPWSLMVEEDCQYIETG